MFDSLREVSRLLVDVELKPVQGDRFQPTGFADLGAAVYQRPDGKRMLLVESAQSMANRLEKTCLEGDGPRISSELDGLPYVHVKLTGQTETETSSLIEAHRINSPYIISDQAFAKRFSELAGYARGLPLDWKKIARAVFHFDPNALLHGVFMANLEDGRIKIPRALTAFIEAEDIREAASGGVKNNPLDPTGTIRAENYDKNVYGNVPYHRVEYVAGKITGYFNFDVSLLKGYGLEPEAWNLMVALGLYKIRRFLSSGLRLRTACDLASSGEVNVRSPEKYVIPAEKDLLGAVQKGIKECAAKGLFSKPAVTLLTTKVVLKADKVSKTEEAEETGAADE